MLVRATPEYLRSDKSPEFVARELRKWLRGLAPERFTLSREALGRTDTARASTASCEMNA
jgi:hypothetical protein